MRLDERGVSGRTGSSTSPAGFQVLSSAGSGRPANLQRLSGCMVERMQASQRANSLILPLIPTATLASLHRAFNPPELPPPSIVISNYRSVPSNGSQREDRTRDRRHLWHRHGGRCIPGR